MASSNRMSASPAQDRRPSTKESSAWPVPVPSRSELTCAFAQALDLAEGRAVGHAGRVCYIALNLARALELPAADQRAVFYAALLHDAGAAPASAELCRVLDLGEDTLFATRAGMAPERIALQVAPTNADAAVDALRVHPELGAKVAADLGFDEAVQEAIGTHHERWDGEGYPNAHGGEDIPVAGRLIGAADLMESLISADQNPLIARRNLLDALSEHAGGVFEIDLAREASGLIRSDEFWLGLHNSVLPQELAATMPESPTEDQRSPTDLKTFASVFAELADKKGQHTGHHSDRTAEVAGEIAEALGFAEGRREVLQVAAIAHDIGLLGVPARVIAKPDILSLSEMEAMRKHPTFSQLVIEALPGLDQVAGWVGAHHERPDGKGYPELLEEGTISLEARILAVADTYVALTSSRPYRGALSEEDALQVIKGGAGTQLDTKLVKLLCSRSKKARSSRTSRRSARTR